MSQFGEQPELAARAAVALRTRLRALASAQTEAFDLLYYEFGAASPTGVVINKVATACPTSPHCWRTSPGRTGSVRRMTA